MSTKVQATEATKTDASAQANGKPQIQAFVLKSNPMFNQQAIVDLRGVGYRELLTIEEQSTDTFLAMQLYRLTSRDLPDVESKARKAHPSVMTANGLVPASQLTGEHYVTFEMTHTAYGQAALTGVLETANVRALEGRIRFNVHCNAHWEYTISAVIGRAIMLDNGDIDTDFGVITQKQLIAAIKSHLKNPNTDQRKQNPRAGFKEHAAYRAYLDARKANK